MKSFARDKVGQGNFSLVPRPHPLLTRKVGLAKIEHFSWGATEKVQDARPFFAEQPTTSSIVTMTTNYVIICLIAMNID